MADKVQQLNSTIPQFFAKTKFFVMASDQSWLFIMVVTTLTPNITVLHEFDDFILDTANDLRSRLKVKKNLSETQQF